MERKLVRLANGVALDVVELGARDGVAVLMLHGYSDSLRSYDLVAPLLPRAWRSVAVTLRGHGESDKPAAGYAIPDLAFDVPLLLDALGVERAVLVGHSLGAAVALQVAADYPSRVEGIVLIGPFADFRGNPGVIELVEAVNKLTDPIDPAFAREFQVSTLANPTPEGFLDMAVGESLKLTANVWRGIGAGLLTFDPIATAKRCRAPALILWGDKDAFVPRRDHTLLADALCSSRVFTLKGVGHAVHWERPAEVAQCLAAFVGELEDIGEAA